MIVEIRSNIIVLGSAGGTLKLHFVFALALPLSFLPLSADAEVGSLPSDTRISLQRTACYGTCPIYSIQVDHSGTVNYGGIDFVQTKGAAKGSVSTEAVRMLVEKLLAIDFLNWPEGVEKKCKEDWEDHPDAIVTLAFSGKSRTVIDYHGCKGNELLDKLRPIEDEIDKALNSSQWISAKGKIKIESVTPPK